MERKPSKLFANAILLHRTISHSDHRGNRANAEPGVKLVAFTVPAVSLVSPACGLLDNTYVPFFV